MIRVINEVFIFLTNMQLTLPEFCIPWCLNYCRRVGIEVREKSQVMKTSNGLAVTIESSF